MLGCECFNCKRLFMCSLIPLVTMNQHQPPSPPLQHIPDRPFITSVLRGPSKREKLRSLARATTQVIKQEINKYAKREDESLYSQGQRSIQPSMTTPLPRSDGPRVRTQSMNGIQRDDLSSSTNTVNPHCMLFPTYASQIMDANHRKKWKIRLTGWTFAKPGSGRIERWIMGNRTIYNLSIIKGLTEKQQPLDGPMEDYPPIQLKISILQGC